ncbi:two-partner secretion domain-containing protein [Paracoccus methylarcula]|uniref:Filamentous hemagglutinin N-terminal domain-containing protein n=1 Tax=Paracoccus methylarcula TaxID=72022 RepID=A0A422R128_9RHOB|nr:filamentous hemagglutinin N-terminal domain-containing protein [Paracoccus methylarcula]RNF35914.1 filamentous hemagglutinin N-terminal domain-containing protein [Paracoccus methylarcula]
MARTTRVSAFPGIFGSERHKRLRAALYTSTLLIAVPALAPAQELPSGGTVASGDVSISTPGAADMLIHQRSDRAVVNWNGFSIGRDASVNIDQPGRSSAILNRVTGEATSGIHGSLTANGRVFIVNPNGIVIGTDGVVSTGGGFVASTLDISDQDFNEGRLRFGGNGRSAEVANHGTIAIQRGGYAALIGGRVNNSGTIVAPLGRIGLGAGERVTLDLSGDGFLQVALPSEDDGEDRALIRNSGRISADGGRIEMKAATARNAARNAINLSGVAEARSVSMRNGAIVLGGGGGGTVRVSGTVRTRAPRPDLTLAASERPPRQRGGNIDITGARIALNGARLDASGAAGGGRIRIGGSFGGKGSLPHAETVSGDADTRILANGMSQGDGGRIVLWSQRRTSFVGNMSARGGSEGGNGGFVEVSSAGQVNYDGRTDLRAPNGHWGTLLIDPTDISVPGTHSEDMIETALAVGNLTLDTSSPDDQAGNIFIGDDSLDGGDISWTADTRFRLIADNDILITSSIMGENGRLNLEADGDITLRGADITVSGLTMNAATIGITDSSVIGNSARGQVSADTFIMSSGTWTQGGSDLSPFDVTDFRLNGFDATFLRVLGGSGGAGDPYLLADVYGLQGMDSSELSGSHFALANDIDASGTATWDNFGEGYGGFDPIGYLGEGGEGAFTGGLDGRERSINGLYVGTSRFRGGLFDTTDGAAIRNLHLTGLRINAQGTAGGLVANAHDTTMENIHTTGQVRLDGDNSSRRAGGIVGTMSDGGSITDSSAGTNIHVGLGEPNEYTIIAGGLAGSVAAGSTISRSFSTGNVTVSADVPSYIEASIGGFVGMLGGTITDAYSSGDVSFNQEAPGEGSGQISIGGFAGLHDTAPSPGTMIRTAAHGDVRVDGGGIEIRAGGHTGTNFFGDIIDSYADGDVTSSSNSTQQVGGLIGYTWQGNVTNTYASGAVDASGTVDTSSTGTISVHGLIGTNAGIGSVGSPSTTVTASFFDRDRTGQTAGGAATAYGQGISTASFRDTAAFLAQAGAQGWDFANVWAPGDSAGHPEIYTIDRVIFAVPDDVTLQYGQAETTGTTGTTFGGPSVYVFAPTGDTAATATVFDSLTFPSRNVGTGQFTLTATSLTSTAGQNYRVVDLPADYEITPAPLVITANDQVKTYGQGFAFLGQEFTTSTLFNDDTVDSIDLASDGADNRANVGEYAITGSSATGSGLSNYDITYADGLMTVDPASLTVTANNQTKPQGETFTFNGTEFTSTGVFAWDSIDSVDLASDGAAGTAGIDGSPYTITAANAQGSGLENYIIDYQPGELTVTATPEDNLPRPDPPFFDLPEPGDDDDTELIPPWATAPLGPSGQPTVLIPRSSAEATLARIDEIAAVLEIAAESCSQNDTDVSRYLACLSDALDDFANKLDEIATDLPPGMENVAEIVRDARRNIDTARTRAEQRLATATTAAEREAIRQDAIGEARVAIATASAEIRSAINFVRAEDPELAGVQTATINRVAEAVDSVGVELSRAVGL